MKMKITIKEEQKKESKKLFVMGQVAFIGIRLIVDSTISFSSFMMFNTILLIVIFVYLCTDIIVEKFLK